MYCSVKATPIIFDSLLFSHNISILYHGECRSLSIINDDHPKVTKFLATELFILCELMTLRISAEDVNKWSTPQSTHIGAQNLLNNASHDLLQL